MRFVKFCIYLFAGIIFAALINLFQYQYLNLKENVILSRVDSDYFSVSEKKFQYKNTVEHNGCRSRIRNSKSSETSRNALQILKETVNTLYESREDFTFEFYSMTEKAIE